MKADLQERVLDAICRTLDEHSAQFDALDEAIGDGDHGTNLKRVGAAIAAKKKQLVGGQPGGEEEQRRKGDQQGVGGEAAHEAVAYHRTRAAP